MELFLANRIVCVRISPEYNRIDIFYPNGSVENYNLTSEVTIPIRNGEIKFDLRELIICR